MSIWVHWPLVSISGLMIWHCHNLQCRSQMELRALLWLWCRPAAAALIRPLAWELPYAMGSSLKSQKKKEEEEEKKERRKEMEQQKAEIFRLCTRGYPEILVSFHNSFNGYFESLCARDFSVCLGFINRGEKRNRKNSSLKAYVPGRVRQLKHI